MSYHPMINLKREDLMRVQNEKENKMISEQHRVNQLKNKGGKKK